MPNTQPKSFAKGFSFTGSINGHRLGWTKARVVFDYRNGTPRVFFEFECGLEVVEEAEQYAAGDPAFAGDEHEWPTRRRVRPRLEQFARPGEDTGVTIEQLDRDGSELGVWHCMQARLVEYVVAWDNGADTVTPERIVFEAPVDAVRGPDHAAG